MLPATPEAIPEVLSPPPDPPNIEVTPDIMELKSNPPDPLEDDVEADEEPFDDAPLLEGFGPNTTAI